MLSNRVHPETTLDKCKYISTRGKSKGKQCDTHVVSGQEFCKRHGVPNKGEGAGGANTNKTGLAFEDRVSCEQRLLSMGFERNKIGKSRSPNGYTLTKKISNKTYIFLKKSGFKKYMLETFGKTVKNEPDESFVVIDENNNVKVFIIEMKNQNVSGSVDLKLLAAPGIRFMYQECLGGKIDVDYCLCLNSWFETMWSEEKYNLWDIYFKKVNVPIFFGEKATYLDDLFSWVGI